MKNTKYLKRNVISMLTIILLSTFFLLLLSANILTAQAEAIELPARFEEKIYTDTIINDNFDSTSILVVMDKYASEINKSHSAKFTKFSCIKSITDLTKIAGNIEKKLYLNKKEFRQIFKIDIKDISKQTVIETITELQNIEGVLWAGTNGYYKTFDTQVNSPNALSGSRYQYQWGIHGMAGANIDTAWDYSTGSKSIKVGVIDTGIADHEDLNDNVEGGWNFINNSDDTNDTIGHGTSVAGIIGATGTNANGVIGANWNVKLVPLKISNDAGDLLWDAMINAVTWSIDNDIDIINISGGGVENCPALKAAFNNFKGLMVFAAGNYSNDNDTTPYYPTCYSYGEDFSNRVISVGATINNGDIWANDLRSDGKIYGSHFGATSVSIFAPGGKDITTTCIKNNTYPNGISGYTDTFGGTSAAAPFVTGVAALLYTKYERYMHQLDDEYIAAQVKATLLNNSTKDGRYDGKCVSGGRLNAAAAMKYCQYIPSIMSGSGYYDGWYYWNGKVDLEIEDPTSFGFDSTNTLFIEKPTNLKFSMITTSAFNAVTEINIAMTFTLKNSSGEVVNIGSSQSLNHTVVVGIVSNSKFGFYDFTITTSALTYHENYTLTWECVSTRRNKSYSYTKSFSFNYDDIPQTASCLADDTLITLADGSQVAVQDLTGEEELLVWNMKTGTFDSAPILFIDKENKRDFEVTNLYFSDGTTVKIIDEHGFWDFNLNQYVFLRNDADKYIGHWFNKQSVDSEGNLIYEKVQLVDMKNQIETTSAWSPVTCSHLCYYVNGMLSMPGNTTGLINIFEIDSQNMKIDEVSYRKDIEKYGLYTYEEFAELCPVPEAIFEAFNGQYLKVAIGKGLTTINDILNLISRYSIFWEK